MYGPVRTVVWQGSAGDRRPYADLVGNPEATRLLTINRDYTQNPASEFRFIPATGQERQFRM